MENQTKMSKISSTTILYRLFPPPDGVEYAFFMDKTRNQSTWTHICLCDVAGKCFVGKGACREAAQETSANHAIEGLGLALVQNDKGNEVVNIANEKRRLEFMVRDLKTDLLSAETRHEAELKLYKDNIQNLRDEVTIHKSDLIKIRDEKEIMTLENEKLKNCINVGKEIQSSESHLDAQFKRKANEAFEKCESPLKPDSLGKRQKICFTLNSMKLQDELKFQNERLINKLAVLEREKKSLQAGKKKAKRKYCEKYDANNKLQKEEIKKLKIKSRKLRQLNVKNFLKIFNLEVKNKAYDDMISQHFAMKEENKELRANIVKLEMQHEQCAIKDGFMKPDAQNVIKSKAVTIVDSVPNGTKNIFKEYISEKFQLKRKDEEMCKLVKVLRGQVKELKENSSEVIESMKNLIHPI